MVSSSSSISSLLVNQTLFYSREVLETFDRLVLQPLLLANYSTYLPGSFDYWSTLWWWSWSSFDLIDIFDDFQWKLCKILVFIVFINLTLITLFWRSYGHKISEKFMQPSSSSKLIEELKNSISELKLPKEHSPRL
jgi:hypothetical protein